MHGSHSSPACCKETPKKLLLALTGKIATGCTAIGSIHSVSSELQNLSCRGLSAYLDWIHHSGPSPVSPFTSCFSDGKRLKGPMDLLLTFVNFATEPTLQSTWMMKYHWFLAHQKKKKKKKMSNVFRASQALKRAPLDFFLDLSTIPIFPPSLLDVVNNNLTLPLTLPLYYKFSTFYINPNFHE